MLKKITSYIVKPISWIFNSSSREGVFDKEMLSELDDGASSSANGFQFNLPKSGVDKENVDTNFPLPDIVSVPPLNNNSNEADASGMDADSVRKKIMDAIQRGEQFTPEEVEKYTRIMNASLAPALITNVTNDNAATSTPGRPSSSRKRPLSPSVRANVPDGKRAQLDSEAADRALASPAVVRPSPSVTSLTMPLASPASVGTPHHVLRNMDRLSTPLY